MEARARVELVLGWAAGKVGPGIRSIVIIYIINLSEWGIFLIYFKLQYLRSEDGLYK